MIGNNTRKSISCVFNISFHDVKVVAVPRREVNAVPRREVVAVPRRKVVAVPRREVVAVPRREVVAVPRHQRWLLFRDIRGGCCSET